MARAPRGFKVRLEPQDEFPHVPDAAANYNESMYFNVFDPTQKVGGWFRIGNRPNEGYAEISVCLYLPDGRVGFMFGAPEDRRQRRDGRRRPEGRGGRAVQAAARDL